MANMHPPENSSPATAPAGRGRGPVVGAAGSAVLSVLVIGLLMIEPVASAVLLACGCHVAGIQKHGPLMWIAVSPLLYLAWLLVLLTIYTLETSVLGLFFEKPRRYDQQEHGWFQPSIFIVVLLYGRAFLILTLPTVPLLVYVPGIRWLILRSYSTSTHLGEGCWLVWGLPDPDLTIIGRRVVIGATSRIIAHSMTHSPEGHLIYQSAPIEFGDNCIIGGAVQVEMGAKIGAGAMVEPRSHVLPFTVIPPGEVWGGAPAVFRRKREAGPTNAKPSPAIPPATSLEAAELHRLIARALGLPPEEINAGSSSTNCLAWDSLGKMAIAAALYDHSGITLSPEKTFALDSMPDVERVACRGKEEAGKHNPAFELPSNPEFLPLFDPAVLVPALARRQLTEPGLFAGSPAVRVVVASTFVAQPLASSLQLFTRAFGIGVSVEFFDFNQVQQALLSPDSRLRANRAGLNVVLLRPEDLPGETGAARKAAAGQILNAIRSFVAGSTGLLLVSDLPPLLSPGEVASQADTDELRLWWRQQLAATAGVQVLGFSEIVEEIGKAASRDARMEAAATAPFSLAVYQRLGISIARAVRRWRIPPKKVVAVDCDGTLWGGVVGEDGRDGIKLGEDAVGRGHLALQGALRSLVDRGVLLVLVSRNLPEDVWEVVERHPAMLLRRTNFAAARINWKPKSENLRELAAEFKLGLDAFVFLDDNPAERLEVERHCPGVAVVPLPANPMQFAETLGRLWLFDGAGETAEDRGRNEFMQQDAQRQELRASVNGLGSYLSSLEMKARFWRAREEDLPRVSQLIEKTNQFNLSLKRRSLPEIRSLPKYYEISVISAGDRYGDYGLVGVAIAQRENDALVLDSLLVSCRALGRGVEEAFLHGLAEEARLMGAKRLRAPFVDGPRNQPMKDFLARSGFRLRAADEYELDLAAAPSAPEHLKLEISV